MFTRFIAPAPSPVATLSLRRMLFPTPPTSKSVSVLVPIPLFDGRSAVLLAKKALSIGSGGEMLDRIGGASSGELEGELLELPLSPFIFSGAGRLCGPLAQGGEYSGGNVVSVIGGGSGRSPCHARNE
jgi:hypothetical protein